MMTTTTSSCLAQQHVNVDEKQHFVTFIVIELINLHLPLTFNPYRDIARIADGDRARFCRPI